LFQTTLMERGRNDEPGFTNVVENQFQPSVREKRLSGEDFGKKKEGGRVPEKGVYAGKNVQKKGIGEEKRRSAILTVRQGGKIKIVMEEEELFELSSGKRTEGEKSVHAGRKFRSKRQHKVGESET